MDKIEYLPGRRGVTQVLRNRPKRLKRILLKSGIRPDKELSEALGKAKELGISVSELDRKEFDLLADGIVAQGILAELRPAKNLELKDVLPDSTVTQSLILLCDQLSDPQNVGAILRAAEAFGVTAVLLTKDKSPALTASLRKASVGASETVPIVRIGNVQQVVKKLKQEGYWILGAALDENSQPLGETQDFEKVCLVVGAEGGGIRPLTKKACDLLVEIPLKGVTSSLNVSQATSILLYHFAALPKKEA